MMGRQALERASRFPPAKFGHASRRRPASIYTASANLLGTGLALALLSIFSFGEARAQSVPKAYLQARQLLLLQRWDQALQLIESVVPGRDEEWLLRESLLAEAYEGQRNYGALEILARQALERKPDRADRTTWLLLRGRLLLLGDDLDSAEAVLEAAWKEQPSDSTIVQVARLYQQHSLSDLALATYLEARRIRRDSVRFALDIAELYEARRDYARATDEYFNAIHVDSAFTRQVENRVLQLVGTAESRDAIEKELKKAALRPDGSVIARRILTTLYLDDGHPDLAWRAALEVDSLLQQHGLNLVSFMRLSTERGYYEAARRAAATLLERYPESPVRYQAEWELASLAKTMGDWQVARDQYAQMSKNSPVARFRFESALEYADLEREHGGNLNRADSVYAMVAGSFETGPYYGRALLGRAEVAVAQGDFDAARSHLTAAATVLPQDPAREEVAYRLGELSYYEGDLEAATEIWKALTVDYDRSPWVNNALDYLFLLSNYSSTAPADLKLLARAEALSRRGRQDSSLVLVSGLRGSAEAPLAPKANFLAAGWHRLAGRSDSALAIWDSFVEAYPDDADAPKAMLLSAKLCEVELHRPEAARSRYAGLLERYPRSHWADEARKRIRLMDGL